MNLYKNILLLLGCTISLQAIENKPQTAQDLITQIEKSIETVDKKLLKESLDTYINLFGQVHEKNVDNEKVYHITFTDKLNGSEDHEKLLDALNSAADYENWGTSIVLHLPIFNSQSSRNLNLDEIIEAIKQAPSSSIQYSIPAIAATTAVILSLLILYRYPAIIQQGSAMIQNQWDDLQDTLHKISKYFTDPQDYQEFEKQHDLNIEGMTLKERRDRFRE